MSVLQEPMTTGTSFILVSSMEKNVETASRPVSTTTEGFFLGESYFLSSEISKSFHPSMPIIPLMSILSTTTCMLGFLWFVCLTNDDSCPTTFALSGLYEVIYRIFSAAIAVVAEKMVKSSAMTVVLKISIPFLYRVIKRVWTAVKTVCTVVHGGLCFLFIQ